MTIVNVLFLVWAVAMLFAAHYFWGRGGTIGPIGMIVGSLMIIVAQALDIYSKVTPHGG